MKITRTIAALAAVAALTACAPQAPTSTTPTTAPTTAAAATPTPAPSTEAPTATTTPTEAPTATKATEDSPDHENEKSSAEIQAEWVENITPKGLNDYTAGLYLNCMNESTGTMDPADCESFARTAQKNGVNGPESHNRWLAEVAGEVEAQAEADAYAEIGDEALDPEETDLVYSDATDLSTEGH